MIIIIIIMIIMITFVDLCWAEVCFFYLEYISDLNSMFADTHEFLNVTCPFFLSDINGNCNMETYFREIRHYQNLIIVHLAVIELYMD
jgi:hypothetical protein